MTRKALTLLVLLAACGTPQERCINGVTRDLRTVDRLIEEAEGNIRRGYAYEETTVYVTRWRPCFAAPPPPPKGEDGGGLPPPKPRLCLDEEPQTVRKAVAIDLNAEARKLDSLKAKRAQQAKASAPAIAQCRAQYPE